MLYFAESCTGIFNEVNSGKSQAVNVLEYIGEGDDACPALRGVKPVAFPRVRDDVRFPTVPNEDSVERVVQNWDVDESPLEEWHEGKGVQELDLSRVRVRSVRGVRVGDKMFD